VAWAGAWMRRRQVTPPLHYEPCDDDLLILLNHHHQCQAILLPDVCRVLRCEHPALCALRELRQAFSHKDTMCALSNTDTHAWPEADASAVRIPWAQGVVRAQVRPHVAHRDAEARPA